MRKINLALQARKDARKNPMPDNKPIPAYPPIDAVNPWQPDEYDRRTKFIEAMTFYSRSLQCTLTKATKGEPHRFAQTTIRQNGSGFESWRALHTNYDQKTQTQQLIQPTEQSHKSYLEFKHEQQRLHQNVYDLERRDLPVRRAVRTYHYEAGQDHFTLEQIEWTGDITSATYGEHDGSGPRSSYADSGKLLQECLHRQ
eukprot:5204447-Amphidinium_carterae.1